MQNSTGHRALTQTARGRRLLLAAGMIVILFFLRTLDPAALSALPIAVSCGSISGLPCLFCGLTRALHALLNGDVSRAVYFNWLAIPVLVTSLLVVGALLFETLSARPLLGWKFRFQMNTRSLGYASLVLGALWVLQIYLALAQHKHELLNSAGPLYSVFVR